jgi:RNA polymerase sigma factor (sigma-70 family)
MSLEDANIRLMESKGNSKKLKAALKQVHWEKMRLVRDKSKDDTGNYIEGDELPSFISTNYRNIEGMSGIVTHLAKGFSNGTDQDDLESEGYVGLTLAMQNFKELGKATWKTYATKIIRETMIDYLRKRDRWDKMEYRGDIDLIVADDVMNPEEECLRKEQVGIAQTKLAEVLATCNERECYVIWNHIIADEPESYRDMAEQFNTSKDSILRDVKRVKALIREGN